MNHKNYIVDSDSLTEGFGNQKGDFYFVDSLEKKIYCVDRKKLIKLTEIFESPYKINSVGFDTNDRIIIVGEYVIPKNATVDGKKQENILPSDSYGTSYGFGTTEMLIQ